ncbi:hypothetical protein RchiOBHm_Chr7g0186461 [Rosa chinensis]|uniref:Uncharacterized protein n=1 Tax=Rosa chinensis TaxID=74649 RepID=A0A2P6P3Y6_ROSCH|nr:hypothetical protein RchiOBHm_Chr7g0186461 [Rosa chinensis]
MLCCFDLITLVFGGLARKMLTSFIPEIKDFILVSSPLLDLASRSCETVYTSLASNKFRETKSSSNLCLENSDKMEYPAVSVRQRIGFKFCFRFRILLGNVIIPPDCNLQMKKEIEMEKKN